LTGEVVMYVVGLVVQKQKARQREKVPVAEKSR
jgi:hypothetical protein